LLPIVTHPSTAETAVNSPLARLAYGCVRPLEAPRSRPTSRHEKPQPISLALRNLVAGQPLVRPEGNRTLGYLVAKRTLDIVGAMVLLTILAPITLVTFLVLLVTTGGRPMFRQQRLGFCGRRFTMYKFRTMCVDAAKKRHLVVNEKQGPIFKNRCDPRVTRVGRFLRAFSIDELPQLFNVLRGEMSLVGPRPPILDEVASYKAWQRRRLAVKPGLTCLWQISGRSEVGFETWVRMDIWYLQNQNLATDLALLWRTPAAVLSGQGAY
jgi:lipopolysaccharide/colanic/teichoic acid biosynthesis glycosyltransferase